MKKREEPIFKVKRGDYLYDVGHWNHLCYMAGAPGTGKTTQLAYLTAAALSGEVIGGYRIDLQDRTVLLLDGEQPQDLYMRGKTKIEYLTKGKGMDRLIYPEQTLASITKVKDREQEMWEIVMKHHKDLGILIIDRIGNFISDINSQVQSERLISKLLAVTEATNCLPIVVSHMTIDKWGNPYKLYGTLGSIINQLFSEGLMTMKRSKYFGLVNHKVRYKPYPQLWAQVDDETGLLVPERYCPYDLKIT